MVVVFARATLPSAAWSPGWILLLGPLTGAAAGGVLGLVTAPLTGRLGGSLPDGAAALLGSDEDAGEEEADDRDDAHPHAQVADHRGAITSAAVAPR